MKGVRKSYIALCITSQMFIMKKIVTVFAVWFFACLIGVLSLYIATSAAAKDESFKSVYSMTEQEVQMLAKSNTGKATSKKTKGTKKKKAAGKASKKKGRVSSVIEDAAFCTVTGEDVGTDMISGMKGSAGQDTNDGNINNSTISKTVKNNTNKTTGKKQTYTDQELRYMTSIIYCEARGESYAGQKAVGIVVMNRKRSKEFPSSIKKVIYQRGQFTPASNGSLDKALSLYDKYSADGKFKGEMPDCYKAAKEALEGSTTVKVHGKEKDMKDYLYFSRYIRNAKYTLGHHQFK